jgi:predicted DNA-binding protein (UPF0251 family)
VVAAYKGAAKLYEQRCRDLMAAKTRTTDGRLGDQCGSITDYRYDAKYCAGMATRLPALLDDRLTTKERDDIIHGLIALENGRDQHTKELPRDPRRLAEWAWDNSWKDDAITLPLPEDGIRKPTLDERMEELHLTQREAEAWILVRGYGFEAEEAAEFMATSPVTVEILVRRAISRMKLRDALDRTS